jgi:hypothetical protein
VSAFDGLAKAAGGALEPLTAALTDARACERLLRELGWNVPISDDTHAAIRDLLPVLELVRSLPELVERVEDGDVVALVQLVEATADVVASIEALGSLDASDLEDLPGTLATPDAWADLAAALPASLLARQLAQGLPAVHGVLRLLGLCVSEHVGATDRQRFQWDIVGEVLADPVAAVRTTVGWDADLQPWPLQRELGLMLTRLGVPVRVRPRVGGSGLQTDVVLFSAATSSGEPTELGVVVAEGDDGGVYIGNQAYGALDLALPINDVWTVSAGGSIDGTGTIGVNLAPSGLAVVGGAGALGASLAIEGSPLQPWTLLGGAGGPRLELAGATLEVGIEGTLSDPDAYALVRLDEGALKLVLDLGAADSFLRNVIPEPPAIDAGFELRWGSSTGLSFGGGLGLEVTIAIDRDAGPFHIESVTLAIGGSDTGAYLRATTIGGLTIGPFSATVEDIGAALELTAGDGLGGLDAQLAFVPPTAIGLELDLEAAGGGGYIWIDAEAGRYVGALSLDFVAIGLDAVVVVDTRLPGDPDGWALFASLSLTFPQIPLGFGFFLAGVGGIVCLNRTMDVEALAGGLKSGAVDAILFPDDAVANAEVIVAGLDAWFPLAPGSLVFGVAGRITWGTPTTIVTADVGIVLTFPELDIAVLGSITIELPEEEPLLELHLDTLGTIDFSEQTVMVVASLYDSTLLHTISLSGDMAMYARLGSDPYFLLSVGGYHPDFQPPGGLPAAVLDLDRMRVEVTISEDVWYALESYVAITSNTLQFGAEATLEASAKFLLTTYTARGSVGFDVLLVLSPFAFSAGFHASVSVTAGSGDNELLAVSLSAHLDGPKPWYATGRASFDFFGIDVAFDFEVGGATGIEAPARKSVLDDVISALKAAGAWRGVLPAGAGAAVQLADDDDDLTARPDAELEAVQTVAPLERPLEHYGVYEITGPTELEVTSAGIGDEEVEYETVLDWFSPAQFDDMSRSEKLAAPSYEQMVAGVRFSTETVRVADPLHCRAVTPTFESKILDPDGTSQVLDAQPLATDLATAAASLRLDRPRDARTVLSPQLKVGPTTWTIADAVTGDGLAPGTTYREALAARRTARPGVRVAPTHAVTP